MKEIIILASNFQSPDYLPWLVWLSRLSKSMQTKKLPVQILVRAHAWVAGQDSPSFFFLSSLSKNKKIKYFFKSPDYPSNSFMINQVNCPTKYINLIQHLQIFKGYPET